MPTPDAADEGGRTRFEGAAPRRVGRGRTRTARAAEAHVRDTSGLLGLPLLLGGSGMQPSVAGLVAVVALWRRA